VLTGLHAQKKGQLLIGLAVGVLFGFLLQKGGVTRYDVIIGQLLLSDFTVVKVMVSAIITGMVGVHFLCGLELARLHPKPGSVGSSVMGGLIFGAGFALLGYCPGTVAGAVGQGSLDALLGGVVGILIGSWLLVAIYPRHQKTWLHQLDFGDLTFPQQLKVNPWVIIIPVAVFLGILLWLLENLGL